MICATTLQAMSQASAVVFSEVGEKFTVYLNGEKKNNTPQSNVKLTGLTSDFYQARIDFEDPSLADFANGNFAVEKGSEVTYIIKKNKKGEYVMRYHGHIGTASNAGDQQDEIERIAEVDDAPASNQNGQINHSTQVTAEPVGTKTTVTQTTTTTTKKQPSAANTTPTGGNVSMGVNVDGVNMGVNVNVSETGGSTDMHMSEETVITTTTTTTTTSQQTTQPTTGPATRPAPRPTVEPAPSGRPVSRCATQMTQTSFVKAKENISSNSFEDSKMTVAKQASKANCMTAAQIKDVMGLFSFETSKLEFAKYAYDFCFNQGDYYEVNSAFQFESSITELNEYLESK